MSFIYEHERPSITVDLVVRRGISDILLIRRKNEPFQHDLALPGGFLNMKETLRACGVRELKEETGVEVLTSELVEIGRYDAVERDPRGRVVSFAYLVDVDRNVKVTAGDDAAAYYWVDYYKAIDPERISLAFDHREILLDVMRNRIVRL